MTNTGNLSPLQLMEIHINTLFCCDAAGRMRCVNEAGEPPAPLFYMGRTPQGNLWRFRHDLPDPILGKVDELCREEPLAGDLASPPQHHASIKAILEELVPLHQQQEYSGPVYWVPENVQPARNAQLIGEANAKLLRLDFSWALPLAENRDIMPIAVTIDQGRAVSICFCSRRPAQATEAGLETVPAFRGRGYATAAVATWAAEVRRLGCIPLYSTSWDNLASQAVARKLRMVLYGEDRSIR